MPSYYSEKQHRPRWHGPPPLGTVMRRAKVREHRRPLPTKETPTDKPEEPLMVESVEDSAPPSAPEWSKWESIKYPHCDGYWRAKVSENGEWTYEFTQDFTTIWEQKAAGVASSAQPPSLSTAPTTTASGPVLLGEAMALAIISRASPQSQPLEASSSRQGANNGCDCASCQDDLSQGVPLDASALTMIEKQDGEGNVTVAGQSAVIPYHKGLSSSAVKTTRKGSSSQQCHAHEAPHHRPHHSKRPARHPKKIGEVVRADKEKKYDSKAIIDNWDWEW